jgi:uncharacterized protein (UPF0276 family)
MIRLTTNLSDPLLELFFEGKNLVDGVEVGPWLGVRQIREYRKALPGIPFYFHGGDLIAGVGLIPGRISKIVAYADCTASPWVSLHIRFWPPVMVRFMVRYGWRIPVPNPERAMRRLIRKVLRLIPRLKVPVLLENLEPPTLDGFDFESRTGRITEVLDRTGCGLLLDLGHARVSAAAFTMDVEEYLSGLPMDRVAQLHVSGPRMHDGRLVDSHEPLQEEDYALVDFILARARPKVVTLEYIRRRDPLEEQLQRLRRILDSRPD